MIEVRCFRSFDALSPLREAIEALNLESEHPDPFSTLGFYENYLKHDELPLHAKGFGLCFLAAFLDGRLLGYLPLKQTRHRVFGLRVSKLSFFAVHDVDLPHVVARKESMPQVVDAFYAYLFTQLRGWGLLEFHQQTLDSPLLMRGVTLLPKRCRMLDWPCWSNCTITVRWNSLDAYFRALSKKYRSNLGRQTRRLFEAGTLEFISSADPAVTPALLELYRGIESRSWKLRAGLCIDRDPRRIEYFQGLLDRTQPMRISVALLLLDGMPIAGLINGAYGHKLYALQIVYDEQLSDCSPGATILLMGLRQAISGGYQAFDLLSGFDYYKNRWLAQVTETTCVQIYRTGSPFFWRRLLGELARRCIPAIQKHLPAVFGTSGKAVTTPTTEPMDLSRTAEQRLCIASLIAEVRRGHCQFLSAGELAAAMPFDVAAKCTSADQAPDQAPNRAPDQNSDQAFNLSKKLFTC